MTTTFSLYLLVILLLVQFSLQSDDVRYISYTVNMGEGFNLRRDVHMRVTNFVRELRKKTSYNWILVLPPWPKLYHWRSRSVSQSWWPWGRFFDVKSLNDYVSSIELEEFIKREGRLNIDEILALQRLENSFTEGGQWMETVQEGTCQGGVVSKGSFTSKEYHVGKITCLSVQGRTFVLLPELIKRAENSKSFVIFRFEQLMHDEFGSIDYWNARKSMVYSKDLRDYGNQFMKTHLNYDPGHGIGRSPPNKGGGAYLSVHLRMQDYQTSKPHLVPSLKGVASQIKKLKKEQKLNVVFIASDAPLSDKQTLQKLIGGKVVWFEPDDTIIGRYGDGGVAIIDQWIASHARYFTGTTESTFSYRIREDRQFMKFSVDSTFNQLCGLQDNEYDPHSCSPPTKWLLVETNHHSEL